MLLYGEKRLRFIKSFLPSWLIPCLMPGATSYLTYGDSNIIWRMLTLIRLTNCRLSGNEGWELWSSCQKPREEKIPNEEHCLYIRAKFRGITRDDILQFAKDNGIRRPDAIIKDVADSLKKFRPIASRYGVNKPWIGRVETTIINHLMAWGVSTYPMNN